MTIPPHSSWIQCFFDRIRLALLEVWLLDSAANYFDSFLDCIDKVSSARVVTAPAMGEPVVSCDQVYLGLGQVIEDPIALAWPGSG